MIVVILLTWNVSAGKGRWRLLPPKSLAITLHKPCMSLNSNIGLIHGIVIHGEFENFRRILIQGLGMLTISSPTFLTERHDAELEKNCTEDGLLPQCLCFASLGIGDLHSYEFLPHTSSPVCYSCRPINRYFRCSCYDWSQNLWISHPLDLIEFQMHGIWYNFVSRSLSAFVA